MKLAIIVGHNSRSQGAVRADTGESEFVWNTELAAMILEKADSWGVEVKVFTRQAQGSYTREIKEVYAKADAWGANAVIELHFNGSDNPDATGTETLTSGTKMSMVLAHDVQAAMIEALGLRDRGHIIRNKGTKGRGYQSMISGKAPAILIEPFFGSSPIGNAATDTVEEKRELAAGILRGAVKAMASFPRSTLDKSRTFDATAKQRTAQNVQVVSGTGAIIGGIVTQLQETVAQIPTGGPLDQWLPYVAAFLSIVALGATVYQKIQTTRIELARLEDHENGVR